MKKPVVPKFRICSKKLFLTYPQCDKGEEAFIRMLKCWGEIKYAIVAREKHKDGTDHRHVACLFEEEVDIKRSDALDVEGCHGNYQSAKRFDDVVDYCRKAGQFIEVGEYHTKAERKKLGVAKKNALLMSKPLHECVDDGDISIMHARNLELSIASYKSSKLPERLEYDDDKVCYWVYGTPGTGKSAWVRQVFGHSMYIKVPEKWWDNYREQEAVLLEDLDGSQAKALVQHIKIWADKYHFCQEVKGGRVNLTFRRFIITSNFLPFELWTDRMLHEAVSRRFVFIKTQIRDPEEGPFFVDAKEFYYDTKI